MNNHKKNIRCRFKPLPLFFNLLLSVILLFPLFGCGEGNDDPAPAPATSEPATLTVQINTEKTTPQEIASIVISVYNGDTSEFARNEIINQIPGDDPVTTGFTLPGGSTYNFIADAWSQQNGGGTKLYEGTTSGVSISWGQNSTVDIYLDMLGIAPPTVSTAPAGTITKNSATLAGQVTPNGYDDPEAYFAWGLDTAYGNSTPVQQIGASIRPLSLTQSINGLSPETTYHFCIVGKNAGNIVFGDDQEFTTSHGLSAVDTYFALSVTENSYNHTGAKLLFLDFQGSTPDISVIQNNIIISQRVNRGVITVNGDASEWDPANLTTVNGLAQNNYPLSEHIDAVPTDVTVGSAWDDEYIYFLVQWEDAGHTRSTTYKKWIFGNQGNNESGWNLKKHTGVTPGAPNENSVNAAHTLAGAENEDRVLMMFPIIDNENNFTEGGLGCAAYCHANLKDDNSTQNYTGKGVAVMHTNLTDDKADIWNWKSGRTSPSGYADDHILIYAFGSKNGRASDIGSAAYSSNRLIGGNPKYRHSSGLDYTGDTLLQADAAAFDGTPSAGDQIPFIISKQPDGSHGDIEAGESYDPVTHRWTIEFKRRLNTGNSDDHQFTTGADAAPPTSTAVSAVNPAAGETLYNSYCRGCHSTNGIGWPGENSWSFPRIQRAPGSLILKAIKTNSVMSGPSLHNLSQQHVENIAAFLQTQATFADTYTLSVSVNGVNGTGRVTGSPAGIDCPNTCSFHYVTDTPVTLTANYIYGYTFAGWSGGGCSGTGTCIVTLSGDRSVTADYTVATNFHTLTVTNSGNGTVTGFPAGIDCGSDCSETFSDGTSITLTATPSPGYGFDGWAGDVCAGTGQCTFTISVGMTVSTSFSAITVPNCENGGVTFDKGGTNGFGLQQVINPVISDNPIDIAFIPGGGSSFIVATQNGRMYYFNGGCDPLNSQNIRSVIGVNSGYYTEGLLSVEFHPDFSSNGYIFFFHTSVANSTNSVTRMTLSFDGNSQMVLSDPVRIIDLRKFGRGHNGGDMVFAPDKTLLASVGDGNPFDNNPNGQLTDNLRGKVIRVNPSLVPSVGGYTIPSGNRFNPENPPCSNVVSSSNPCPEILAMGLRNPFRMSIDGNIVYLGVIGSSYEELNSFDYTDNTINFGNPIYDGPGGEPEYRDPILAYRRSNDATSNLFRDEDPLSRYTGSASIISGDVYRGSRYDGQLTGRIFHAEFYDGYIRALGVDASGNRTDMGIHLIHHQGISSMIVGPDDYVYIVSHGNSGGIKMVYRLVKP